MGGVGFFIENPTRGGVSRRGRGREGVCGELGNFLGGGGAKFFFSGPKRPPRAILRFRGLCSKHSGSQLQDVSARMPSLKTLSALIKEIDAFLLN